MINTWYEFFEELATKIYEKYKVNKNNIPACIQDFTDSIKKLDNVYYNRKREHMIFDENNQIIEVDPFTLFSHLAFRRGTQWLFTYIKNTYGLATSVDIKDKSSFVGMPGPGRGNVTYYAFQSRNKTDITTLWKLFFSAIEYADTPSAASMATFKNCLTNALGVKQVGIDKMSDGLFWIRPKFYISVNGTNRPYIVKKYGLPVDTAKSPKSPSAVDAYLNTLDEIKKIESNNENAMIDISIEAYKNRKSTSKQKQKEKGELNEKQDKLVCPIPPSHPSAYNKIFYGVPGCGKSYHIEHDVLGEIFNDKDYIENKAKYSHNVFRTIFYQDYSHADFVGQYMPKRINGQVEYTFVPKVFTKALERAYQKPNEPVVLIIEEINRGDAASIFGDIFQLLDRKNDGESEYKIDCDEIVDYLSNVKNKNEIITKIVGENEKEGTNKIYIPSNLYLLATMNTCDQNVFALDTAFKRRWRMEEIPNEFKGHKIKNLRVPYDFDGKYITWEKFVMVVNKQIVDSSDEFFGDDRQIGCFFVDNTCLLDDTNNMSTNKAKNFAYKVISYLWNDVAKLNRNEWFVDKVKTLHDAIAKFADNDDVFSSNLKTKLLEGETQPSNSQAEAEENESTEE